MLHVFALGPLNLASDAPLHAVMAHDLASDRAVGPFIEPRVAVGLAKMAMTHAGQEIVVEPALKEAAAVHGWKAAPLGAGTQVMRAGLSVSLASGARERHLMPLLHELIAASVRFQKARPWVRIDSDMPYTLRLTGMMQRQYEASIMGNGGQSFGLILYPVMGSLAKIVRTKGGPEARNIPMLALDLADEPAFAVQVMQEAHGVDRVPALLRLEGGKPRPAQRDEILALIGGLEAAAQILDVSRGEAEVTVPGGKITAVLERAKPGFVPELIQGGAEKVGRNDACPCGSGKKHKKCCGASA